MESGGASKWSMANLRSANEELRQHVIQLKAELEQERKQSRQAHREKVAGIRTARDEEQARGLAAREDLKTKMNQERGNEIRQLKEDTEKQRDLELQLLARQHDENIKNTVARHEREKAELEKVMKTQVYQQAKRDVQEQFEVEKKKLMQEMFQMQTAKLEAEKRMQIAVDSDREKADKIRQLNHEHQEEVQRLRRDAKQSSRRQTEELRSKERELHQREQELVAVARKASVVRAEKEEVEEKLRRTQEAESWQKMSPRAATPGLGDVSFEAVTAPTHMRRFTDEEKRRIAHSAELSQQNRRLEEKNGNLVREKEDLQRELDEARQMRQPLEAKCEKLMKRNNQLVTVARDLERKMKKLKEETESAKEERDSLVQKVEQLERTAKRQPVRVGERQLAAYKNEVDVRNQQIEEQKKTISTLKEKNVRLRQRLEVVKTSRQSLMIERDQIRSPGLSKSWDEESVGSTLQEDLDQAVFDKDETEEKYKEVMKERLKLERSYAQMQVRLGTAVDVERDKLMREQMEMDLSESRDKVILLEMKLEEQRRNVEEMISEEKRELEEKVREREEELAQTRLELEKSLDETNMQVTDLKNELEEATKISGENQQEILGFQEQLDESVIEAAEHKAARDTAELSLSETRQEVEDLRTALLESQRQLADWQKQNEELAEREEESELLRKRADELESARIAEAAIREEMQAKLESLAAELTCTEERTSELRDTHNAEVTRLEEELDRLQRRQSDDVSVAVEQLETQLRVALSESDGYKEAAEQSRERVVELENSLMELKEKLSENGESAAALLTVQERNRELSERLTAVEEQLTEGHQQLVKSQEHVEGLQQQNDALRQERNTLQESERGLKEHAERLQDSENELKELVEKLEDSERSLKERLEEAQENGDELRRQLKELESKSSQSDKVTFESIPLDTSSIAFVSVQDQNGEVDEFTQVLKDRVRELESLMQATQRKRIEEEAKRILSLRNEEMGDEGSQMANERLRHSVTERHAEEEEAPPLPATAPPPLDDLSIDIHGVPPASNGSAMNDEHAARIDQLEAELTTLSDRCEREERQRKLAEETVVALEMNLGELETRAARFDELQAMQQSLEKENDELSAQVARLNAVEDDAAQLENRLQENDGVLRARQSDLNRLQRERDEVLRRNVLLTQQVRDLDEAVDERHRMKEKLKEVEEKRASDYDQFARELQTQSQLIDDEKRRGLEAEKLLVPLQADNKFLERKCTAKDDVIADLNSQLTKLKKALTGSLLEDLRILDEENELTEHNPNRMVRNHAMGSMELSEALKTIDEAHLLNRMPPHAARPGSAPSPVIRLAKESLTPSTELSLSRLSHRSASPFMENKTMFVTLFDYDPDVLCTTQQPELELKLQAGDVIAITGDMNENGMYLAESDGRRGLIPANFVEQLDINDPMCKSRLINKAATPDVNSRPRIAPTEQHSSVNTSTDLFHQAALPDLYSTEIDWNGSLQGDLNEDDPDPPDQLCVERQLDDSLLVAWKPPDLSPLGQSNGTVVAGYKVYVDQKEHSLLLGAEKTKALLENIDVMSPKQIGLQTVGRNGRVSQIVGMTFSGRRPSSLTSSQYELLAGANRLHPDDERSVDGESVTTFNDAIEPFDMFVALYDYHPMTMSPNPDPEAELSFKEGDLIKVFGEENDDGFYNAKLNGQQGLVPSNFIEPVSSSWQQQRSQMVRQVHQQRLRMGNSISPGGAQFSDSEDFKSQTDTTSDVSSDAATDAKSSFVGVYPGMPHMTSGLSLTAGNEMSDGQFPRRVSFASESDLSGTGDDEYVSTKKHSILSKGKQLIKKISGIRRSTSKSNSTTPS